MKISEFDKEHEKTFMLLPGTSCTWEINFNLLVESLSQGKQIHINHVFIGSSDLDQVSFCGQAGDSLHGYADEVDGETSG